MTNKGPPGISGIDGPLGKSLIKLNKIRNYNQQSLKTDCSYSAKFISKR